MRPSIMAAQDTIVARATAAGAGGVAIVRLSGPRSWAVGRALLPWTARRPIIPRRMELGLVVDPASGEAVDQALAVFFRGPHSYTTEDSVEIHCHGGSACVWRVIGLAQAQGCRLAGPGEFTMRAMLGGRLDLTQAEAVGRLAAAQSDIEARLAMTMLAGGLGRALGPARQAIVAAAASVEAAIDFPDDAPELAGPAQATALEDGAARPLAALLAGTVGRAAYWEGAKVAICGRPNVGKSSLFNALLGRQRAIVSERPGATRDVVDEVLILGGVACRLADTAGLGPAADELDRLGQERATSFLADCDLALVLLDGSRPLTSADHAVLALCQDRPRLLVVNKADLPPAWQPSALGLGPTLAISATSGLGLNELARAVAEALCQGAAEPAPGEVVVNARQRAALGRGLALVRRAVAELGRPEPRPELISLDLAGALAALGEVDGQGAPDEVIEAVFSTFCVGK